MTLDEFVNLSKIQRSNWFEQANVEERETLKLKLAEMLRSQGTEIVDLGNHQFALLNQDQNPSNFPDLGLNQKTLNCLEEIVVIKRDRGESKVDVGFH